MSWGETALLKGLSFLLVEDEILIAMDAKSMLEEAGAEIVEVASKVADALRVLSTMVPHAAILDVNLRSGTSFPIADELATRGIPFIFCTGYGSQIVLPPRHISVPVVGKPYTYERLIAGVTEELNRRGRANEVGMKPRGQVSPPAR